MDRSERLLECATSVLMAAPGRRLKAVLLNKALFYLDVAALRDRGETLTHHPFIAIDNGPVVAKYQSRLIDNLLARGIASQESEWDGSKPVILKSPPSKLELFDQDTDLQRLVAAVTSHFSKMTSKQASEYSHENPGWEIAWKERLRSGKPRPINMQIALQQIVEDDPWVHEPSGGMEDILLSADNEEGEEW